jgi:AcrR family transcriptional regulator
MLTVNGDSVSEDLVKSNGRRQRERLQRRADILRAAERIFAAKGFHAASIEAIARGAEYGTGTVYLYFTDKQSLYVELFEQKIRELSAFIQEQVQGAEGPLQKLRRLVYARLQYFEHNRAFFQVYAREGMDSDLGREARWKGVRRLFANNLAFLTRLIAAGQEHGLIRQGEARQFAVALSGMMIQLTRDWLRQQGGAPLTEQAEFVLDLFLLGARQEPKPGVKPCA